MFGSLGIGELVLIAGIALVVMGPEKFPEFAKIVMRTVRDLRGYVNDVKQDIEREVRPIEREVRNLSRYDPESYMDALTGSSESKTPSYSPEQENKARQVEEDYAGKGGMTGSEPAPPAEPGETTPGGDAEQADVSEEDTTPESEDPPSEADYRD